MSQNINLQYSDVIKYNWLSYVKNIKICLETVIISDTKGKNFSIADGLYAWINAGISLVKLKKCLYLVGNGASASLSSHFAADLNKNAGIKTHLFTDAAMLTAIGNDISFERIFAEPLQKYAAKDDMLMTISSSGNSKNILCAIEAARQIGMNIITLSGMNANNKSRYLGDINIYAPAMTYGLVESAHAVLLHFFTDQLVAALA